MIIERRLLTYGAVIAMIPGIAAAAERTGLLYANGAPAGPVRFSEIDAVTQAFEAFVADEVARRGTVAAPVEAAGAGNGAPPWWTAAATSGGAGTQPLKLADMIDRAAASSLQIGVFGALPAIRDTSIDEARGRFTPEAFAEIRHADRNEPTTSLAQTAGNRRLIELENSGEVGVRARMNTGGQITLAQRFSNLDSNIITYNPRVQARARTTLSLVQPLLREAGVAYNAAPEAIAAAEADAARNEFRRQAESHLLEVTRSYWTLYLARANYAQERAAAAVVDDIAGKLSRRSELDAQPLQLSRAKAVAAERAAGLVRAANAVRNAEARLKALINDPALTAAGAPEIVPADRPSAAPMPVDLKLLTTTAMAERPEVRSAFLAYRAALLREGIAGNERLPQLDLVLEGSTNGGRNGGAVFPSFTDAFENRASYVAGVRFSVPLGNDERRARLQRRHIETMQQALQARSTVDTVVLELEVSANEFVASRNELARRGEALRLAGADQQVITGRWQAGLGSNSGGGNDGTFYLDQLLGGQDRLVRSELDYAEAEATAMVAAANLSRARGTLLADLGYAIARDDSVAGNQAARYRLVRTAPR